MRSAMRWRRNGILGVAASLCPLMLATSCSVLDCQGEVDAAYRKRDKSAYVGETISEGAVSSFLEFAPPDRMRVVTRSGLQGIRWATVHGTAWMACGANCRTTSACPRSTPKCTINPMGHL